MINCVVGKPGTGKTYFLLKKAVKALRSGRDVYSNFWIDFDKLRKLRLLGKKSGGLFYWHDIADLINIKQGLILMDECQIWFNSRKWQTLDERAQYKLQQHRKHGLDILGASQNLKRIDSVMRELINEVYEVKRLGRFFLVKTFEVEDIDKAKRKSYGYRAYFLNKKLANCFDTFQEIKKI